MEILLKHLLLAYLGQVLHLLKKYNDTKQAERKTFIQKQKINTIMTIIAIPLTLYLIHDNAFLQEQMPLTSFTSVMVGYIGQSLLLSMLSKKEKNESENKSNPTDGSIADPAI
jgi:hypothetical protein